MVGNLNAQLSIDFSHERGFYNENFGLIIQIEGDDVKTRYTTDGSQPTKDYGTSYNGSGSIAILNLNKSTVIRVFAYNTNESVSASQTYLFVDDIFNQNNSEVINKLSYPSKWGYGSSIFRNLECRSQIANYGVSVNKCQSNEPNYMQQLYDGLMQIPSMSISLDKNQLFGLDSGLYIYPLEQQDTCYTLPQNVNSWERKASVEIFNDVVDGDTLSTQINAGLKISGFASRYFDFYKHSFHLQFSDTYGTPNLNYPLYGKKGVSSFKNLELRMIEHCSPHDWVDSRRTQSQFHKDKWTRGLQKQLSGESASVSSKFFHLFINGLYWGVYDVCERPDANYMANHYGGEPDDYDVINLLNVESGSDADYKYMYDKGHAIYDTILTNQFVNPITGDTIYEVDVVTNKNRAANFYSEIENLLDIESFINYNLLNLYLVNIDWKDNNWIAAKNKTDGKFQFFIWDAELVLNNAGISNQVVLNAGNFLDQYKYHPIDLNQRLFDVPEYKIKFGDHIQCHCVEEDGVLNPANLIASYKTAEENINKAIMLEFARWADARKEDLSYEPICFDVVENTLQDYETTVFPDLLNEMLALYGNPSAEYKLFPAFIKKDRRNGVSTFDEIFNFKAVRFSKLGGEVEKGYQLSLTNPNNIGDIYYTIDGSDPRNIDGTIAATALKYDTPITINAQTEIKARIFTETFVYSYITPKTIDNLWTTMCPRKFYMPGELPQEEIPVSIDTNTNYNIKIFPKPVKNNLNIKGLTNEKGNYAVSIFSITGKVLIKENVTGTTATLNTSKLPNGYYVLSINKNNKIIFSDKFTK